MPIPSKGGLIQPAPELIARILKEALISPLDKVLLIGQNSNYINQLISRLTDNLFVIDQNLNLLPEMRFRLKNDMSFYGWVEEAPFDIIILFGSVEEIPQNLISQLKNNGKLIFPLSSGEGNHILTAVNRFGNSFDIKSLGSSYIHKLR